MPYEISFKKHVIVADPDVYINDCCWGGDIVRDQILPSIVANYEHIQTEQEDWGWFIWFHRGQVRLAVDIFCDDPQEGAFRIRLTSRHKKLFFMGPAVDTSELEQVREIVISAITAWAGPSTIEKVD